MLWNPSSAASSSTNGFNTFFINSNPILNNSPTSLLRNPPGSIILDSRDFDNLISVDELKFVYQSIIIQGEK